MIRNDFDDILENTLSVYEDNGDDTSPLQTLRETSQSLEKLRGFSLSVGVSVLKLFIPHRKYYMKKLNLKQKTIIDFFENQYNLLYS